MQIQLHLRGVTTLKEGKIKKWPLILSWALYDLANQFFALNVVSLYFVRWLTLEKGAPEILYSAAFGISIFFVAISAPVMGVISDETQRRRPFLVFLTLLSVIFTMVLGVNNIILALIFFIIANFGCQSAIVFYNALMVDVAPKNKLGLVSGLGRMFGYSGAILALYLVKPALLKNGYQATFLPTGILFLIFSLPCMIFIKDKNPKATIALAAFLKKDRIYKIFRVLKGAISDAQGYPGLLDFLKCAFFGLSAVNVVILFMSVYATRVFGLNEAGVINLTAFSTLFAIGGSLFSGFISDYFGHKRCLGAVFILWAVCFFFGAFARDIRMYWFVGALAGVALGSTWVLSRALAIEIAPKEKIGEVFGLFNLVGYLSAIAGAIFWGLLLLLLADFGEIRYRVALFSLILFVLLGFFYLLRVPQK